MYGLTQILKAIRKPREALMELNARWNWARQGEDYYRDGKDMMAADWDYLVLLDALRYDIMCEENELPGDLSKVVSKGGGTREWLRGNFRGRTFPDTVYINANPQLSRIAEELNVEFHKVFHIWESDWDDDLQTVRPETVRIKSIEIAEEYPNKRLLVHFVQPHPPFIGPTGQEHDFGGVITSDDSVYFENFIQPFFDSILLRVDENWERAYRENLRLALSEVEQLFDTLDGKFVVTSDHGELLGERTGPIPIRYHGHRIGCHHEKLLAVPWLVFEHGSRRTVSEGNSVSTRSQTDEVIKDRLRQLGYAE